VKFSLVVLGVVLVLTGGIFTAQGLGYLAGSPMTGVTLWAVVGPILAIVGIALIIWAARTGRSGHAG
jgi:drug/metabolite transporter superfamily protein YnfA